MIRSFIILFTLFLLCSFNFYQENEIYKKPLWEEEEHYRYYRTICIESSILRIETLLDKLVFQREYSDKIIYLIFFEIDSCKDLLGIPLD